MFKQLTKFFKKKEKIIEKKEEKIIKPLVIKKKDKKAVRKKIQEKVEKKTERKLLIIPEVIKAPHISEKASFLGKKNQYVFKVESRANKPEIKQAIEKIYGVKVKKVRLIKIPPKERRRGKNIGWRLGYKKAVVSFKGGDKIEILPR